MRKILSLLLSVLIFTTPVFASSQPQVWVLQDFSKGKNSHISDLNTPSNQCVEANNVRFNLRYGALGKRDALITAWDTGSSTNNALWRFYKSDGTIKTIIATGAYLDIGDADATTTTHISSVSDGKRWQGVTFKDIWIGTNGSDQPLKYDGFTLTTANTDATRVASELCAELGAPFAERNTGSNLTASKWYQYKMMFLVSGVAYYSNARSNPLSTGSSVKDIYLTDIPIGPTGTTARYVYRTIGDTDQATVEADTTFYLAATISDNTTRVLADAMADATLTGQTAWSTSGKYNATPPKGKYCELHKERLWITGNTTYLSYMYFSDDGNPDFFDYDDFEVIRADDGDEITFIKSAQGILRVGKTNSIQSYYTDGSTTTDWYASDPLSYIGCPAPYSVAVSPIGIIYLGRHGLYRFDGQNSYLISDAVTPDINDISQADIEDTVGIYHNNEYRLAYTSTASGLAYNNRVLLYDLIRDAYTVDTENVKCWVAFSAGTDVGTLYSGSSYTDGYVVAHFPTTASLSKRYKSEFDAGTFDDTRTTGTEDNPEIELAWDCTIDGWLTELQTKDANITTINSIATYLPNAIIDRPDTDGTWESPVYRIDAEALDKFYWNENLGSYGDITWQVKLGATSAACVSASYGTAVTNPNGSDLSGTTANGYIRLRANLSTTNINYTPTLYLADGYLFKLIYSKVGSKNETSVLSEWKSGWVNFTKGSQYEGDRKLIQRIRLFYQGSAGTLSLNIKGSDGDLNKTITIDLSKDIDSSTTDEYYGEGDLKVYEFLAPINSDTEPSLVSQLFQFRIIESGTTVWEVNKLETKYTVEEDY